jgi:protein O-mannosyl-transferase
VLSAIALILITAVCWHYRKDKPYCLVGWLWFLGTLVPVIGIVQVGDQALAERYTYISFIGIFIMIVWLAADTVVKYPKIRLATQLLAVAVITACAVKTYAQVKIWKDTITNFTHVLEVDPRGDFPNFNLGMAYLKQGKNAEAQPYFERALVYGPTEPVYLYSAFSLIFSRDHRNMQLAGERLEQAYHLAPDDPDVLTYMALWSSLTGKPKDEEMYSSKLLAAHPDRIAARVYLGDALFAQGRLAEAGKEYQQVIDHDQNNYNAHNGLGNVFNGERLKQKALDEFQLSLDINPNQSIPHAQIGNIFLEAHQLSEAVEQLNQAIRLSPANANVHNDLGMALFQQGDYGRAAAQFSDALELNPDYAAARKNLERTQARLKK